VSASATVAEAPARSACTCTSCSRKGWLCQFLEESLKTPLPRTIQFTDEKIWEMAKRDCFTLNISGRQELEEAIRRKRGGIWLELTPEQYEKLREPFSAGNRRSATTLKPVEGH
jgi:hypothetical protein